MFGGAYVYTGHHLKTITGGRAELDYFIHDNLVLRVEERYDAYFNNQLLIGVSFSLGGTENRGTLKSQLKAPIFRHLNINSTKQATPNGSYQQISTESVLLNNNIFFVSNQNDILLLQNSLFPLENGTFEHPYTSIDQAFLPGNAPEYAMVWVEGTDHAYPSQGFTMLGTQSLSGRTSGFLNPALAINAQPVLSSTANAAAVVMYNSNSVQNLIIEGTNAAGTIGLSISGDDTNNSAYINNVTIGSQNSAFAFETGLSNMAANVVVNNSRLYAAANDGGLGVNATAFGVVNNDTDTEVVASTRLDNTLVNVNALVTGGNIATAYGILNEAGDNAATMILQNGTTVVVNAQGDNLEYAGAFAYGIYNLGGTLVQPPSNPEATANVYVQSNTSVTVTAGNANNNTSNFGANAFGIYTTQNINASGPTVYGGIANVIIDHSTISASQYGSDTANPGQGTATGIFQGAQANYQKTANTVTIKNNSIVAAQANGNEVGVTGIGVFNYSGFDVTDNSLLSIRNSEVRITAGANAGTSYGIFLISSNANLANATVNVIHRNIDNSATGVAVNGGQVALSNGTLINVTGLNPGFAGNSYFGLMNKDIIGVSASHVTIAASTLNVESIGGAGGIAYGITNNGDTSTITINQGSVINASATNSGLAYGINNGDTNLGSPGGTINVSRSSFNLSTNGTGTSYGFWDAATNGVINTTSTSLITANLSYDPAVGNVNLYNIGDIMGYNPYPPTQNVTFSCNNGACP